MSDFQKAKFKKILTDIVENTDIQKFILVGLDSEGKATVHIQDTNMMENAFMSKVLDDLFTRLLRGEKFE